MKASINYNNLKTNMDITPENVEDFISYVKLMKNKNKTYVKSVINDPNPIMCYSGEQRVIPCTDIPYNVTTYNLEEFQNENEGSIIMEYELEGKRFINCTPHDIVFHYLKRNEVIVMKPSSTLVRVYTEFERGTNDTHIYNKQKSVSIDIPAPEEGIVYIVSQVVFNLLPERTDLVFPNSLHAVRDADNRVIGVHAFVER